MIGPQRGALLASLVREAKPTLVVECGTAIGYSTLWIARELKALGKGRLITIEIDPERSREAEANVRRAGLSDLVTFRVGDARKLSGEIEGPIDLAFIDCDFPNYMPVFAGLEKSLADGATLVADNAGIGAAQMAEYLAAVRSKGFSRAENKFVEITAGDLPWDQVRKALANIGFAGWATAEVGGGDVKRLTVVREQMQQAFGL